MAEQNPGQIFTPGNNEDKPAEFPANQANEVAVELTHEQVSNEAPANAVPPQPVEVTPPAPTYTPEASPPVMPEQTPEIAGQAEPQVTEPAPQPESVQPGPLPQQQFQAELSPEESTHLGATSDDSISWTASEYIAHHKSPAWFLLLGIGALAFSLLVYFVTSGDKLSAAVVVLVAVVFGISAARQPKVQQYEVNNSGVSIGPKAYGYEQFKSFSVIDDGPFSSITFMPLKRFMPTISIYYDPKDEDRIATILSSHLPLENRDNDFVDKLMRKIRF